MDSDQVIPTPRRVLIIKPSALGDVVTAMPVLRGFRRTFGQSVRIDWLVNRAYAPLLEQQPELDAIIPFDRQEFGRWSRGLGGAGALLGLCRRLRRAGYDWVIDVQGLFRSAFFARVAAAPVRAGFAAAREGARRFYTHTLPADRMPAHTVDRNIALARMMGVDARAEDYRLTVSSAARQFAAEVARRLGGRYVLAAPGTRWPTKLYPMHHWRAVVYELARQVGVVLTAGPGETHLTAGLAGGDGVLDLAGRTSLDQLVGLVAAARAVVCCDSAVMNIAAAVGVSPVALAGPTDPARTGPYRRGEGVLRAPVACAACRRRRCRHVSCMESIAPAAVLAAVRASLSDERT